MGVIHLPIPPQAFEVVRDRIGRILAQEFDEQFQISYNIDFRVLNWIERFIPFDRVELPSINVMLAEGTYGGQTVIQSDGTYRFYIDCYVNARADKNIPADVKAMQKLHRLLGLCRAIIEDARYKTLGFPPGFVMFRRFESIQIQNPNQKHDDAESSVMGRLTLSVKVPEITSYVQPVPGTRFETSVKLSETDKGYLWILLNGATPYYFDSGFDSYFE